RRARWGTLYARRGRDTNLRPIIVSTTLALREEHDEYRGSRRLVPENVCLPPKPRRNASPREILLRKARLVRDQKKPHANSSQCGKPQGPDPPREQNRC